MRMDFLYQDHYLEKFFCQGNKKHAKISREHCEVVTFKKRGIIIMINKWMDKLDRKFRRFGITNLMSYIVGGHALVFMLDLMDPTRSFSHQLAFRLDSVLAGEVWRVVTFLFIPPTTSLIFFVFVLYLYYMIGTTLESIWGTFKFNLYYFIGAFATILAGVISGDAVNSLYINLSLFLAFATLFPDYQLRLFLLLPIKIRYLAYLNVFILLMTFVRGDFSTRLAVGVAFLNYFLFFGEDAVKGFRFKKKATDNRRKFMAKAKKAREGPIHRCTVCGITEEDDPDMDFRYCSKCEGDYEYCMEHLKNHEHITGGAGEK